MIYLLYNNEVKIQNLLFMMFGDWVVFTEPNPHIN